MSTAHRPLRLAGLLAGVCALATLSATAGELYQWTDANGVTHYSDSPPPDRQYQSRRYVADRSAPVAAAGEEAEPAVAANSQCVTAKANLELLQGEGPVGIDSDQDGKPDSALGAEQRDAQRKLAEAAIAVHCKPAAAG